MSESVVNTAKTKRLKPGERKIEILNALLDLMQKSDQKHITTKSLASHLGISEAALYRHFSSKTEMYHCLIENVLSAIMTAINNACETHTSGVDQAFFITKSLIEMRTTQPNIVLLLSGDALTNEDERLQQTINQFFGKIQTYIKQSLRMAIAQNELAQNYAVALHAEALVTLVLGSWFRFAKGAKTHECQDPDSLIRLAMAE